MPDENDPESWGRRIMEWWKSVAEMVERDEEERSAA